MMALWQAPQATTETVRPSMRALWMGCWRSTRQTWRITLRPNWMLTSSTQAGSSGKSNIYSRNMHEETN